MSGAGEGVAVVVCGSDAAAVQAAAAALRAAGEVDAVAAFVGEAGAEARAMGEDLFPGRAIEVRAVRAVPPTGPATGPAAG